MAEPGAIQILQRWRQRWIIYKLITITLYALAYALIGGSIFHFFGLNWLWALLVLVLVFIVLLMRTRPWQITLVDVSRYLNTLYPELEESCELLIKSGGFLNILETLQKHKVAEALSQLDEPKGFTSGLKLSGVIVILAVILTLAFTKLTYRFRASAGGVYTAASSQKNLPPEKLLPQINEFEVKIIPPAYTGKPVRAQQRFGLEVEEGATVAWNITTNTDVKHVALLFNEKQTLILHSVNGDHTKWVAQKQIDAPGFYQVNIEGKLSDYYQVETIKDMPPVISIKTPKQYTYIDAGEIPKVPMTVAISDDYGINDAFINATVAKGSGEAVKFKEQKMTFPVSFNGHERQYQLQKLFDLTALGMEPGDELYFYIQATDNHRQQTRTDVYIVSIQDTAALLSMNNMTLGVSLIPEYFRSERQIIMDTEKLLKDKDSITVDQFKIRSNNIGIDQKLLRLRYGKFLGEEEESTEGGIKSGLDNPEDFSNAKKVLDAYTDKHDNAEDAGYLEKDTKEQLKATLNEMWRAELNLRTFTVQAAVPFEYKALRLLKDLQQKSRAYVPKTAYNPPPLKLVEKRLSGDLSKIGQPLTRQDIKPGTDEFETLKKAASVLELVKQTRIVAPGDRHTLQLAGEQLSQRASAQPMVYLAAVGAMHRVLSAAKVNLADIATVEKALQKALPSAVKLPQQNLMNADMGLSQGYFKNLNHSRQ